MPRRNRDDPPPGRQIPAGLPTACAFGGNAAVMIPRQAADLLERVRLGYVATVCDDGTPNLSPKGTILALDESHLVFAEIRSPGTIRNIRSNPAVEVNAVDTASRRGYRFKGTASILEDGDELEEILRMYKARGVRSRINAAVKIRVSAVSEVTSPLYDLGMSEAEIREISSRRG